MSENIGLGALKRAVEILGSQALLGDACGVRQSAVSECLRNGKRVPAEWCIPIDLATAAKGERISCHQLRPDLWPSDFVPQPEEKAA